MLQLLGALGLFLLGMWLLTEGLKLAGGKALEHLLGTWTKSRSRGFAAGVLVTALVQSSSAVTVATIGFVNASLMTFRQSVWVIFGSNVGTTLTAWLVTLFGFTVKLDAYTFALIGIGAFLKVFGWSDRARSFGMALAGFGLLFMGIGALQQTFSSLTGQIDLAAFSAWIGNAYIAGLLLGTLLTVLTQSSSAALALILTAVATQLASLELAAAAVIGANIGTTSTALLATLGATANAKRLAFAHVLFNCVTAVVALLLISPLLLGISWLEHTLNFTSAATLTVTIFHSVFNLLGVMLMLPLEPRMSAYLLRCFNQKRTGTTSQLDNNISQIPDLATRAAQTELKQLYAQVLSIDLQSLVQPQQKPAAMAQIEQGLNQLNLFVQNCAQQQLTEQHAHSFTQVLIASHYLHNANNALKQISSLDLASTQHDASPRLALTQWLKQAHYVCQTADQQSWQEALADYQHLKMAILSNALQQGLPEVDNLLQCASLAKRFTEQMLQLNTFEQLDSPLSENNSNTVSADELESTPQ